MSISFGNFFADQNCPGMVNQAKANVAAANVANTAAVANTNEKDAYVSKSKSKKEKTNKVLRTLATIGLVVGAAVGTYFGKSKIQKAVSGHAIDKAALGDNLKKAGSGIWGSVKEVFKVFKKRV